MTKSIHSLEDMRQATAEYEIATARLARAKAACWNTIVIAAAILLLATPAFVIAAYRWAL